MAEKDAELEQALKQAKGRKMFFAFIPKGSEGKLIVSKTRIPPKQIAEAKREIGGGAAITGKCFGPTGNLVFQVAKEPPHTLGAALKKVAHRDGGLTIIPDVQIAADADAEEVAATDVAGTAAGAPAPGPAAGAAAPGAGLPDFTARLKALMPAIQQAQTDAAHPSGQEVKAWAAEAGTLAARHDFAQAHAVLDKVEAAVKAGESGAHRSAEPDIRQRVLNVKANLDQKIAALDKHPQHASFAYSINDIKTKAERAFKLAQPPQNKYQEALDALYPLFEACDKVRFDADFAERDAARIRLLDDHYRQKILERKKEIDDKIAALEHHAQHDHLAKEIQDAKARLAAALKLAEPHPEETHQEAFKALEAVYVLCLDLQTKADMYQQMYDDLESPGLGVVKLQALLKKDPDNAKILDQLVASLDDRTSQKIVEAAIQARFGVAVHQYEHKKAGADADITDLSGSSAVSPDLPDKSLKRMYELLGRVPAGHTKDNPKLKEIIRFTQDKGGGAYYPDGKIYLYCGRADNTQPYQLAKPSELLAVDDNCKPRDNTAPDYFDFATLHEVGHAVDDKVGFMTQNMSGPTYGAWERTNVGAVAKVAAKFFGYDVDYIESRLSGHTPAPAKRPDDTTADNWKKAQDKADKWCDGVRLRQGYELWRDGAGSSAVAIDDLVYQEAYKNSWVRYYLGARKKGISGYQFRAPGEWFAELYAAYHSGKLQDSHPAMSWLKKL